MARPRRPQSCAQCKVLCEKEPEGERPACWYGRSCPFKMAEHNPEVLRAYEFAMQAISRIEHTKGERAGTVEYSTTREAIQFAAWAEALHAADDRQGAIALVEHTLAGCEIGSDWETTRAVARRRIGTEYEEPLDRLVLDLDEIDEGT